MVHTSTPVSVRRTTGEIPTVSCNPVGAYARTMRFEIPEPVFKAMNAIHQGILKVSGGRLGGNLMGMPVVELTTIGRKSGQPRTVLLTSPVQQGDDVVLVASKGGNDHHPAWYLNLLDEPKVELDMNGQHVIATARVATADEKAELWPQIVDAYKGYADYQSTTDRDIPVVICTPTG